MKNEKEKKKRRRKREGKPEVSSSVGVRVGAPSSRGAAGGRLWQGPWKTEKGKKSRRESVSTTAALAMTQRRERKTSARESEKARERERESSSGGSAVSGTECSVRERRGKRASGGKWSGSARGVRTQRRAARSGRAMPGDGAPPPLSPPLPSRRARLGCSVLRQRRGRALAAVLRWRGEGRGEGAVAAPNATRSFFPPFPSLSLSFPSSVSLSPHPALPRPRSLACTTAVRGSRRLAEENRAAKPSCPRLRGVFQPRMKHGGRLASARRSRRAARALERRDCAACRPSGCRQRQDGRGEVARRWKGAGS